MKEIYEREYKIIDKSDSEKTEDLVKSIIETKNDLIKSYKNYEFAEKGLIDYYSYNIKAYQTKLDYLIKQAKDKGIFLDNVDASIYKMNF